MKKYKIFVSYSRKDASDLANKISDALSDEHSIFTDIKNIQLGEDWSHAIEHNISTCDIFVVIVTLKSLISLEVEKEVSRAQENKKKIIPCFYSKIKKNELKWGLEKLQGIEFDTGDQLVRELSFKINLSGPPRDPAIKLRECASLMSEQNYEEALNCYNEAMISYPRTRGISHKIALSLLALKRSKESIHYFDMSATEDHNESDSWYSKGVTSYLMGKYNEAINHFEKGLKLRSDEMEVWMYIGDIYYRDLAQYANADNSYDKVTRIAPNYSYVWYVRGKIASKEGDYVKALEFYDKAVALNPNFLSAWNNKGVIFHKLQRYEDANQAFDTAKIISPTDADVWYNSANILLDCKSPNLINSSLNKVTMLEEAVEAYNEATTLSPEFIDAWINKSIALRRLNRKNESKESMEMAKELIKNLEH
jgi:tetratricopeptide (TPR) repeat protein